jgi:cytochrome b involved in lipid metabolism
MNAPSTVNSLPSSKKMANEHEDPTSDRKMNDSTLPPPRDVPATAAMPPPPSRALPPNAEHSMKASAVARAKVPARKRGFGLSDWTRLVASSKDLALRRGAPLRQIKWKEIRRHSTVIDGWLVLRGKVYFISPYLAYHPGGEKILKPVLGKDASSLFDKYHQWVNIEKYGVASGSCWSCFH